MPDANISALGRSSPETRQDHRPGFSTIRLGVRQCSLGFVFPICLVNPAQDAQRLRCNVLGCEAQMLKHFLAGRGRAEAIQAELRRLNYDTANATHPAAMAALMKLVPVSQITYGTDYPYFPLNQIDNLRQLNLPAADLQAITNGNAARLVPRLSG